MITNPSFTYDDSDKLEQLIHQIVLAHSPLPSSLPTSSATAPSLIALTSTISNSGINRLPQSISYILFEDATELLANHYLVSWHWWNSIVTNISESLVQL
jgi:hypothetical protein